MKQKKFLKLVNPKHGYYSHEDQEVHGLQFRVFYSDAKIALFLIQGEGREIQKYIARFEATDIIELSDAKMKLEIENQIKPGQKPCDFCEGKGIITIQAFNPIKEKQKKKRRIDNGNIKEDREREKRSL